MTPPTEAKDGEPNGEHKPRLVLATANPHKAAEIAAILGSSVDLVPRPTEVPDVLEDADTLEGNARLKAEAICGATGLPALADDTGLEVQALGGDPGARAARYAGEDGNATANMDLLLSELAARHAVTTADRAAAFRTVALVRWPDGSEVLAEGVCRGRIADHPAGDEGFGYDPVFQPAEPATGGPGDRTFAQMPAAEKDAISHRGKALRALAERLGLGPDRPS